MANVVKLLKRIALIPTAVAANWRDIQHALAEFNESAAFDVSDGRSAVSPLLGYFKISNVTQSEVDKFLHALFAQEI
jgi:hypothetical protein